METAFVVLWLLLMLLMCVVVFAFLCFVVEELEFNHEPSKYERNVNDAVVGALPNLSNLEQKFGVFATSTQQQQLFSFSALSTDYDENDDDKNQPIVVAAAARKKSGGVVWYRRRGVRRWTLAVCVVIFAVAAAAIAYVFNVEGVKRLGRHGFEWTERYATVIGPCGERRETISTRMRYLGEGKYLPVIRTRGSDVASVLWEFSLIGYNPSIFCMNETVYLIGSANIEVHINVLASAPATGRINILNLDTLAIFEARVPMNTCIDEMFSKCGLDSKFSMVFFKGCWIAYIRSNPLKGGGARHVQLMKSYDYCITWTSFVLVEIDGMQVSKNNNIYFFDVYNVNETHVGARFPAVFGTEGGIYECESEDAVRWTAPRKIRSVAAHGARTTLHPSGASHALRINLHFDENDVELFEIDSFGRLQEDSTFSTRTLV